jgi:hypothetical protein
MSVPRKTLPDAEINEFEEEDEGKLPRQRWFLTASRNGKMRRAACAQ